MWRRPRPRRCVKTPVVVFVAENVRRFFSVPATDTECLFLGARPGRSLTARDADVGVGTNARVPPPSVSELPGRRNEDVPVAS